MNGVSILSDTNPLVYLLDGSEAAFEYLNGKQIWISVIPELELFGKKGLRKTEIAEIELLLENCIIVDINPEIKRITKKLMQGIQIKLPDAIVSATSIYLDLPLLSSDGGFKKVKDLNFIHLEF
jgi:predicted nucleic acid-binding protein